MNKNILKQLRMAVLKRTRYRRVNMGQNVYIGTGTLIRPGSTQIGDHVSIGRYCQLGTRDLRIGKWVMISSYVGIIDRDAHDARTIGKPFIETEPEAGQPTIIEDDVWIGFGVIILSGVTIGEGAIVASGSVVVKDVPPYAIIASPKADVIATRFDEATAQRHRELLRQNYY